MLMCPCCGKPVLATRRDPVTDTGGIRAYAVLRALGMEHAAIAANADLDAVWPGFRAWVAARSDILCAPV